MRINWARKYKRLNLTRRRQFSLHNNYRLRLLKVRTADFLLANSWKIIVGAALFFFLLFVYYSKDLPSPDKIRRKEGFSIVLTDRNEKPLYDIYSDKNRIPIEFENLPDYLKKATIAIEDKDFYKRQGFSSRGMLRAFINILTFKGL